MKILGVIPSRYASTRFPGKPLVDIQGKSMIRRVYEQARKASTLSKVVVATDDERIFNHVKEFGGEVLMTSKSHDNGTSRCHEALNKLQNDAGFDVVINIQGDEPFIEPTQIDMLCKLFLMPEADIGTLVKKIQQEEELSDENVVKVVFGNQKRAMYFSRQAIPFARGKQKSDWIIQHDYYKHIGIYGYMADVLNKIVRLNEGKLEKTEKLEQLRWLENSYRILVDITDIESIAIDTPEDLSKFNNKH